MRSILLTALLLPLSAHAWEFKSSVDDFDNTSLHAISVGSEPGSDAAVLFVRCDDGGPAYVQLSTDEVLDAEYEYNSLSGGSTGSRVELSLDGTRLKGLMLTGLWPLAESYKSVYSYGAKPFVRKVRSGALLQARFYDALGGQHTAAFKVEGLDAAVQQLAPHCRAL